MSRYYGMHEMESLGILYTFKDLKDDSWDETPLAGSVHAEIARLRKLVAIGKGNPVFVQETDPSLLAATGTHFIWHQTDVNGNVITTWNGIGEG